jgi:hypothetical protein
VGCVAVCVLKCTIGCCALSAKSPNMGYPILGGQQRPNIRSSLIQTQTVRMPHCKTSHLKYQIRRCTKIYTMVDLRSLNLGNTESYEKKTVQNFEGHEIKSKFLTGQTSSGNPVLPKMSFLDTRYKVTYSPRQDGSILGRYSCTSH